MKTLSRFGLAAFMLSLAACSGGSKVAVAPDSVIGNWQVVTTKATRDAGLCYAVSAPVESRGTFAGKRSTPYLMATRRTSGKIEVSASSGYPYRQGSGVELAGGKKIFALKVKGNVAWAENDKQDKAIVTVLRKIHTVEISGITVKGDTMVDSYSTEGFSDALKRVKELCP